MGSGDGQDSGFRFKVYLPTAFVGGVVMPWTERQHVAEVGGAPIFPIFDVVN